jgi:hypothetical protein
MGQTGRQLVSLARLAKMENLAAQDPGARMAAMGAREVKEARAAPVEKAGTAISAEEEMEAMAATEATEAEQISLGMRPRSGVPRFSASSPQSDAAAGHFSGGGR